MKGFSLFILPLLIYFMALPVHSEEAAKKGEVKRDVNREYLERHYSNNYPQSELLGDNSIFKVGNYYLGARGLKLEIPVEDINFNFLAYYQNRYDYLHKTFPYAEERLLDGFAAIMAESKQPSFVREYQCNIKLGDSCHLENKHVTYLQFKFNDYDDLHYFKIVVEEAGKKSLNQFISQIIEKYGEPFWVSGSKKTEKKPTIRSNKVILNYSDHGTASITISAKHREFTTVYTYEGRSQKLESLQKTIEYSYTSELAKILEQKKIEDSSSNSNSKG